MSKKLENNGLWESSRMMLPEHREALIQRKETDGSARPNVPSHEELVWIRSYALLPMMLTIVENNYKSIETSGLALRKLYVTATQILMNQIHADLVKVKRSLRERNIKVYEDERLEGAIRYRFICRGYEDSFAIIRDVVRAEISVKMAEYVASIFQALKKNAT